MNHNRLTPIDGSTRRPVSQARLIGPTDGNTTIRLSVYVRRAPAEVLRAEATLDALKRTAPARRIYPDRATFDRQFGADPADLKSITDWATGAGLRVVDSSQRTRRIRLEGTVSNISSAFGVEINDYEHPQHGKYRSREGTLNTPADLHGVVEGVFGIDNRRVARSRRRSSGLRPVAYEEFVGPRANERAQPAAAFAALANKWPGTFFPLQVARLYDYPANATGAGENVAIVAFNGSIQGGADPRGGYDLAALTTYFENVLGGTMPAIQDVVVSGPGNFPGPDTSASERNGDATGEVMLDVCVVGSCAPGAKIFMYFTEFSTQGWVDAVHEAITDDNDISIMSISYGNPEDDPDGLWTAMGVRTVNQAFEASIARGVTILCASGDDGSGDGAGTGLHVDFPASSPNVVGVGGTKLIAASATVIASETVWNEESLGEGATGGGVSSIFSKPNYQSAIAVPKASNGTIGRGVPDVAANADPLTGVVVMHVSGKHLVPIGGTSASTPLWAALIARINQAIQKPCGFLNPTLYASGPNTGANRDIVVGNNGAFEAGPGWDACSGWGSPNGQRLLEVLQKG